jgi:hypothetical protein
VRARLPPAVSLALGLPQPLQHKDEGEQQLGDVICIRVSAVAARAARPVPVASESPSPTRSHGRFKSGRTAKSGELDDTCKFFIVRVAALTQALDSASRTVRSLGTGRD